VAGLILNMRGSVFGSSVVSYSLKSSGFTSECSGHSRLATIQPMD
jgi:hypothetical protein